MTSTFTIKLKKTQTSEAVEFELTDSTAGVQRQVDWGSAWGFENFNYRTNSTAMDSSAGTSVLGGSSSMTARPSRRRRPHRSCSEAKTRLSLVPICVFCVDTPSNTHSFPTLVNEFTHSTTTTTLCFFLYRPYHPLGNHNFALQLYRYVVYAICSGAESAMAGLFNGNSSTTFFQTVGQRMSGRFLAVYSMANAKPCRNVGGKIRELSHVRYSSWEWRAFTNFRLCPGEREGYMHMVCNERLMVSESVSFLIDNSLKKGSEVSQMSSGYPGPAHLVHSKVLRLSSPLCTNVGNVYWAGNRKTDFRQSKAKKGFNEHNKDSEPFSVSLLSEEEGSAASSKGFPTQILDTSNTFCESWSTFDNSFLATKGKREKRCMKFIVHSNILDWTAETASLARWQAACVTRSVETPGGGTLAFFAFEPIIVITLRTSYGDFGFGPLHLQRHRLEFHLAEVADDPQDGFRANLDTSRGSINK
ncbi:hypothetical protein BKA70DRAFT_1230992 [Coprinopsis sp. MPI-PUGE-AT-0042]|nr:hypothetical protein BKA70DRAFT_1230992 [Coprinopsis sp. MPI-PUGE-AT-0042]